MFRILSALLLVLAIAIPASASPKPSTAQLKARLWTIRGGAPGVIVTVTNLDTGATRSAVTNDSGLYRAPLLPLGTYRVSAELQGFRDLRADRRSR